MVHVAPNALLSDFKELLLRALRPDNDEWASRVTVVELLRGDAPLSEATLDVLGISQGSAVLAVLGTRSVECLRVEEAARDLKRADQHVVLSLPDGTTEIVAQAFFRCVSIQSLWIPSSVTRIGPEAFAYCSALRTLSIPDTVAHIGNGAFYACRSLKSLTLPSSLRSIGASAFGACNSLMTLSIPECVKSIEKEAFTDCEALQGLSIPLSVTSIGQEAFYNCESLLSLDLPSSVTRIGDMAFAKCRALRTVRLSSSVREMGRGVFFGCRLSHLSIETLGGPEPAWFQAIQRALPSECQIAWMKKCLTQQDGSSSCGLWWLRRVLSALRTGRSKPRKLLLEPLLCRLPNSLASVDPPRPESAGRWADSSGSEGFIDESKALEAWRFAICDDIVIYI